MDYRTVQDIEEELDQYQEEGNLGKVMDLVDELGNLEDQLHTACANADWNEIIFLSDEICMDLTEYDYLKAAAMNGQTEVIKHLIQHGSDIHAEGDGALHAAAVCNQLEAVQCLVSLGADVHARGERAIKDATENDFLDIVQCLAEAGAEASIDAILAQADLATYHPDVYEWVISFKEAQEFKEKLEEDLSEDEDEIALPKTKI